MRDTCSLGSPLGGYALAPAGHADWSARDGRVLHALMRAGFGYVTQGNRVLPVLPMRRAVLRLARGARRPAKLAARRKDVARALRNTPPAHPLELRVSTDLLQACEKLEAFHEQSWVGPALVRVWEAMLQAGTLIVLELWCDGAMVAADFGHPIGGSFYVATRWHDPALAKHQTGFVLALASARLLERCGVALWDLGGTDCSAGMRYKESVSEVVPRPVFANLFRRVRDAVPADGSLAQRLAAATGPTGIAITEGDLFS